MVETITYDSENEINASLALNENIYCEPSTSKPLTTTTSTHKPSNNLNDLHILCDLQNRTKFNNKLIDK